MMFTPQKTIQRLASLGLLLVAGLLLSACSGATPASPTLPPGPIMGTVAGLPPEVALEVQEAFRAATGLPAAGIEIVEVERRDWPDACLGLPLQAEMCAQVITPGFRVVVEAGDQRAVYRSDLTGATIRREDPGAQSGLPGATRTPASIQVFLVALEEESQPGMVIGCGDSLVPIQVQVRGSGFAYETALEALLNLEQETYAGSGLYNALQASDLEPVELQLNEHTLTVRLEGELSLGGVCDNPRFEAQLRQTLLQFPEVEAVEIYINGVPLEQLLSGKGEG